MRAEDLKPSAARQTALLRALGHPVPAYLHVPLMLGPDGQRLSKRHGSVAIAELREQGHTPEMLKGALLHPFENWPS